MKIRFVSDLHFEINGSVPPFIAGNSDEYLIVAGDTTLTTYLDCRRLDPVAVAARNLFSQFVEQVSGFRSIFFILGNHEHYRGVFDDSAQLLNDYLYRHLGVSPDQYHILDNTTVPLGSNTILFGATLWTNMGEDAPAAHAVVGDGMNDFRLISKRSLEQLGRFTTRNAFMQHQHTVREISEILSRYSTKKIIMATHHAPSYRSADPDDYNADLIDGYCSNLDTLILAHPHITDWIHGHTHVNVDYRIGSCRIQSNQRGYVNHPRSSRHRFDEETFNSRFVEVSSL